jgi:predicted nucleotide-binding protein
LHIPPTIPAIPVPTCAEPNLVSTCNSSAASEPQASTSTPQEDDVEVYIMNSHSEIASVICVLHYYKKCLLIVHSCTYEESAKLVATKWKKSHDCLSK